MYNLTDFQDAYPGGSVALQQAAGIDVTDVFYSLHCPEVLIKYDRSLCLEILDSETPEVVEPVPGALSSMPYGEPSWSTFSFKSPYYAESHH